MNVYNLKLEKLAVLSTLEKPQFTVLSWHCVKINSFSHFIGSCTRLNVWHVTFLGLIKPCVNLRWGGEGAASLKLPPDIPCCPPNRFQSPITTSPKSLLQCPMLQVWPSDSISPRRPSQRKLIHSFLPFRVVFWLSSWLLPLPRAHLSIVSY